MEINWVQPDHPVEMGLKTLEEIVMFTFHPDRL